MNEVKIFQLNIMASTSNSAYHSFTTSAIPTNTEKYVIIASDDVVNIDMEEEGKYSIFEISNWFLSKEPMTQKKLQKLCYYAQAWCYALRGYRLMDSDFQAWIHGPVSPVLWDRFKSFGYDSIQIKGNLECKIASEDVHLLEDVWDTYGESTGNALEALTHRELPWMEARRGYESDERCSVVISPTTMASYYKSIYAGD